ncbi:MAG: hypothetical protein QF878_00450 [SAR202 cluster bacterium]|jgi:hypothetical protein|nr:hypothetical protein [SAR202 cluster bacterium]MDP6713650.1 hypothetical protein [SAR202 cluster bacterium]
MIWQPETGCPNIDAGSENERRIESGPMAGVPSEGTPVLPVDGQIPPDDPRLLSSWARRQRVAEDRLAELGLVGQLFSLLFAIAAFPVKALVHARLRMKRNRRVRDMLYGPADQDEGPSSKE